MIVLLVLIAGDVLARPKRTDTFHSAQADRQSKGITGGESRTANADGLFVRAHLGEQSTENGSACFARGKQRIEVIEGLKPSCQALEIEAKSGQPLVFLPSRLEGLPSKHPLAVWLQPVGARAGGCCH